MRQNESMMMKGEQGFKAVCGMTILTGLTCFLASFESLEGPWLQFYNLLNPKDHQFSTFPKEIRLYNAMLGGVMVGWGITLYLLTSEIKKNPIVWKAVFTGLVLWFILDSVGSYAAGVPLNIALNTLFFSLFLLGLLGLKK